MLSSCGRRCLLLWFTQEMKVSLICVTLTASLFAGEVPEDVRTASPDGAFQVNIVKAGDTNTRRLEIIGKGGKRLFVSPPQIDGETICDFYPDHLRWSSDSRILAIAAGYPKLFRTYLFAWDGTSFAQIAMPELAAGEDNPWIYPTEWRQDHTLHLKITGPHAGKARDSGYVGTAVVKVELETNTSKKLSEKVKSYGPKQ